METNSSSSERMFKEEEGFHIPSNPAHCHPPSLERLNLRFEHFLKPVEDYIRESTVLDIGCHNGKFCHSCLKMGAKEVRGIDSDENYVREAAANVPQGKFEAADCFEVEGKYDVLLCLGIIYYVEPLQLLKKMRMMCNKILILDTFTMPYPDQGRLIGTVPNRWTLERWILEAGFSYKKAPVGDEMPDTYKSGMRASYWCKPLITIL